MPTVLTIFCRMVSLEIGEISSSFGPNPFIMTRAVSLSLVPCPLSSASTRLYELSMPPIITIDTSPAPVYIDAHHSTHGLTTLLHNDQLILLEVQGTLEYNFDNKEKAGDIKLGDISWDEAVYFDLCITLTG